MQLPFPQGWPRGSTVVYYELEVLTKLSHGIFLQVWYSIRNTKWKLTRNTFADAGENRDVRVTNGKLLEKISTLEDNVGAHVANIAARLDVL